jgi:hypothetical protein
MHFHVSDTGSDPFQLGGSDIELSLPARNVEVFGQVPTSLLSGNYYVPLAANFAAVDALTTDAGLQFTVIPIHPLKGVQTINDLAKLYVGDELPIVFVVPAEIETTFKKQKIVTADGKTPKSMPRVKQYVAGLALGIETSAIDAPGTKKRRISTA